MRECNCELDRTSCPEQKDLVGGIQYPNMSCEAILMGMKMMKRRVDDNSDAILIGISPIEREYIELANGILDTDSTISPNQMVQLTHE